MAGQEIRNVMELWDAAKQLIRMEVTDASYTAWVENLTPVTIQDQRVILEVSDIFTQQLLNDRYHSLFSLSLTQAARRPLTASLLLREEIENLGLNHNMGGNGMLNPKYTFQTFVTGNSNRFAHAASKAVADNPANAYNPLFIYGGVGLGKTHLMHAIGHFVLDKDSAVNILYISSEMFTNDLINSISTNKMNEFRARYRSVDVLMVDDIQFIAGKEQTQEEFFHTFNTLYEANKQIIISSDKQPKEIPLLEDRLRSRFEWGLIADIQKPDLETRSAILQKKAELENLQVPNEVNQFIANKVDSNIRELEGCLNRVVAYAHLIGKMITLPLAEEVLRDMLSIRDPKRITADTVMTVICEYYNVGKNDMLGQKRNREIALPRQIAMYLLREIVGQSYPQIGGFFGGRDHTTVLHAYNKIAQEIKDDERMKVTIDDLTKRLLEA